MSTRPVRRAALALGAIVLSATALQAADLPRYEEAPPAPTFAAWNPWMVRVRALTVVPERSGTVTAGGAVVPGGKVDATVAAVPELDISYFFTPNWAAELILGTSWHDAKGAGALSSLGRLGKVFLLPPTLTVQYHFTNFGAFKPYVGVGVNYTIAYGLESAALSRFRVSSEWAPALQVGFDYMIDRHWGLNVDLKKLFLSPVAKGFLGSAPVRAKLDLDPWLVGAGVTYKF